MKLINAVCFSILMDQHREGVEEAHPEYIKEKLQVFENCSEFGAISLLDIRNKNRLYSWANRWNIKLPVE